MSKVKQLEEFFLPLTNQAAFVHSSGDINPYSFPYSNEDVLQIDISRVREFCLSDEGLIEHRYRSIAWLELCQISHSALEKSCRLRDKGLFGNPNF